MDYVKKKIEIVRHIGAIACYSHFFTRLMTTLKYKKSILKKLDASNKEILFIRLKNLDAL